MPFRTEKSLRMFWQVEFAALLDLQKITGAGQPIDFPAGQAQMTSSALSSFGPALMLSQLRLPFSWTALAEVVGWLQISARRLLPRAFFCNGRAGDCAAGMEE
jgi:hypothetical protein